MRKESFIVLRVNHSLEWLQSFVPYYLIVGGSITILSLPLAAKLIGGFSLADMIGNGIKKCILSFKREAEEIWPRVESLRCRAIEVRTRLSPSFKVCVIVISRLRPGLTIRQRSQNPDIETRKKPSTVKLWQLLSMSLF